ADYAQRVGQHADLLARPQAHALAHGADQVTDLQELPAEPPGDVLRAGHDLLGRQGEAHVSHFVPSWSSAPLLAWRSICSIAASVSAAAFTSMRRGSPGFHHS